MKPWLWLPATVSHSLAPPAINLLGALSAASQPPRWMPLKWRSLYFPNPVGISGGVDKNARNISAWWKLGVGFIEVGTVTPQPQSPNPGRIIQRITKERSLWNKMGFPNDGAESVRNRIIALKERETPLFLNLGKNRTTPNENAIDDYIQLIESFTGLVEGFVINISSPNTKGLRDLFDPTVLSPFLKALRQAAGRTPLLLKLGPDQSDESTLSIIDLGLENSIDGFILTNTTTARPSEVAFLPKEGGLSGAHLKSRSEAVLSLVSRHITKQNLDQDPLVISAGGVSEFQDIVKRRELGAHLVQIYSAIVFEGPYLFKTLARKASERETHEH